MAKVNFHQNPRATHGKCFEYTREAIDAINWGIDYKCPLYNRELPKRVVTRKELEGRASGLATVNALDSKYLLED